MRSLILWDPDNATILRKRNKNVKILPQPIEMILAAESLFNENKSKVSPFMAPRIVPAGKIIKSTNMYCPSFKVELKKNQ